MTQLVLLKPHTHALVAHVPGDQIDVDPVTAQWLLTHGVAAAVPPKAEPQAKAAKSANYFQAPPTHQPTFKKENQP